MIWGQQQRLIGSINLESDSSIECANQVTRVDDGREGVDCRLRFQWSLIRLQPQQKLTRFKQSVCV